ncbi:MAG: hypothetical protein RIQ71_871 [Verrucomicrobiota bacterium]|jgi:hypothetical protein
MILLGTVFLAGCYLDSHGIVESQFFLAHDSKLPPWLEKINMSQKTKAATVIFRFYTDGDVRISVETNDWEVIAEINDFRLIQSPTSNDASLAFQLRRGEDVETYLRADEQLPLVRFAPSK